MQKQDWKSSLSDRVPVKQVWGPEFKPHYHQKKEKKEKENSPYLDCHLKYGILEFFLSSSYIHSIFKWLAWTFQNHVALMHTLWPEILFLEVYPK
jgi:hypothetical protein